MTESEETAFLSQRREQRHDHLRQHLAMLEQEWQKNLPMTDVQRQELYYSIAFERAELARTQTEHTQNVGQVALSATLDLPTYQIAS